MPIPLGILAVAGAGAGTIGDFVRLETSLITSNTASVTFSNLSSYSQYKHLQLRVTARASTASDNNLFLRFNSDTTTSYRSHHLYSTRSSVASFDNGAGTSLYVWSYPNSGTTANVYGAQIIDILDFSSANKNTTVRSLINDEINDFVAINSGLWNNTAAITSITVLTGSSTSFAAGSRFSLYGIV